MPTCTTDWNPLIIAVATLLTVQVPAIVAMLLNQYKMKHDLSVTKSLGYQIDRKTDAQTVILSNGYHNHSGIDGANGVPGRDADPNLNQ